MARKFEDAKVVDTEFKKIEAQLIVQSMARVRVSADCKVSAQDLVAGSERLSGGYRPPFDSVSEVLAGAQFTRVPWQKKPTLRITAEEDGYVYVYAVSKDPTVEGDVEKKEVSGLVSGPYLNKAKMFRVKLKRNQSFTFRGFEGAVIAAGITVK